MKQIEESIVHFVTASNPFPNSPSWIVAAFSSKPQADEWAAKAEERTTSLQERLGPVWFELVDGKVQDKLKKDQEKRSIDPTELHDLYMEYRRALVRRLNPWDPDMQVDIEYGTTTIYKVLTVPFNPLEVITSEVEEEDGLGEEGW